MNANMYSQANIEISKYKLNIHSTAKMNISTLKCGICYLTTHIGLRQTCKGSLKTLIRTCY